MTGDRLAYDGGHRTVKLVTATELNVETAETGTAAKVEVAEDSVKEDEVPGPLAST